ncbi:cell division protein ZapA (FtsZ GTPase activity inhibitor) [Bacillus fengqiuensis]|nr:cell division protein ZapA (FtsZ GTPase activity inhibitor) [Bacillus fengqiuensis]
MEILGVIAAFFILYELIKTKNELIDLNETVKELKKQLEKKKD